MFLVIVFSKRLSFAKRMYLQITLITVNSGNVFKSFCIFTLALWSPLQHPGSAGRTSGTSDTSPKAFRQSWNYLGYSDGEPLSKLSFHWSLSSYDWFCFSHFSLSFIFNQIGFTVRKNSTIYYCILRNKLLHQAFKVISFLQ